MATNVDESHYENSTPEENFFDDDFEALIQNLDDDESIEEALDDISTNVSM